MFCVECGASVNDDAKFCVECGAAQLNSEQPVNPPKTDDSLTSNIITTSVNDPLAYFKAIGAIIIFVILAGYFVFSTNEDTSTVDTSEDTQTVVVPTQTAEEKARLAEEGERMRAASVARENTVGRVEQQQLRNEAGAGNEKAYTTISTDKHDYGNYDGSQQLRCGKTIDCTDRNAIINAMQIRLHSPFLNKSYDQACAYQISLIQRLPDNDSYFTTFSNPIQSMLSDCNEE